MPIYLPALQEVYDDLVKRGLKPEKTWTEKEVFPFLGQTAKEMWETFAPELSRDEKEAYAEKIRDIEETLI